MFLKGKEKKIEVYYFLNFTDAFRRRTALREPGGHMGARGAGAALRGGTLGRLDLDRRLCARRRAALLAHAHAPRDQVDFVTWLLE